MLIIFNNVWQMVLIDQVCELAYSYIQYVANHHSYITYKVRMLAFTMIDEVATRLNTIPYKGYMWYMLLQSWHQLSLY